MCFHKGSQIALSVNSRWLIEMQWMNFTPTDIYTQQILILQKPTKLLNRKNSYKFQIVP